MGKLRNNVPVSSGKHGMLVVGVDGRSSKADRRVQTADGPLDDERGVGCAVPGKGAAAQQCRQRRPAFLPADNTRAAAQPGAPASGCRDK